MKTLHLSSQNETIGDTAVSQPNKIENYHFSHAMWSIKLIRGLKKEKVSPFLIALPHCPKNAKSSSFSPSSHSTVP